MASTNVQRKLFEAFIILAQHRNFTAAAARARLSQPAFSQAISRLEAIARVRLFERNSRHVTLTPEGELLLPVAKRITQDVEGIFLDLRDRAGAAAGKVTVASIPSPVATWLPGLVVQFRALYPRLTVHLHDIASDVIVERLRNGEVDLGVTRDVIHEDEFESESLHVESFVLVCHPSHELAQAPSVELRQLAGHEFIRMVRGSSLRQRLDPELEAVGVRDSGHEVTSMLTAEGLVAHGLGVTIVTKPMAGSFVRAGLCAVPIADPGLSSTLRLLKRRGHDLSFAASAFRQLMMECPPLST
jgi:LysR family transcriptional regulator, carnitine catabolism transcriptional activator